MLTAVESARGALGEFVGQARLVQNIDLIMAPFSRREAVLSNRIEGTYTEVRSVLLYEARPDRQPADPDLQEVLNYLHVLGSGHEWVGAGRPVGLPFIRGLHRDLLKDVRGAEKTPGIFRTDQVFIGDRAGGFNQARFVPPTPEQVPPLMDDLIHFIESPRQYGPLIDCAILH